MEAVECVSAIDVTQHFWNAAVEAMNAAQLRDLELRRLHHLLAYTWRNSGFYRAKWSAAGLTSSQLETLDEVDALPFTEKAELQQTQEEAPPLGANQCAPFDRLIRMQATGGTTGRPLRMGMTRKDVNAYNEVGARAGWLAGIRPGDMLFECMNYSLYAGGVSDHMTFETIGACVAPVSVGQSQRLIEIIRDMRLPVALYSTPSYALHLADVARKEGLEPEQLGIRRGYFSGDAGLGIPEYRREIERTWGLEARDIYGLGELGPLAAECDQRDGLHWVGQGLFLAEVVDVDTGCALPFEDGVVGELVFTTLVREAHPLVRFRTHDHVRITTAECRCGRAGFRFHVLGRSDDMFIVKGVNVYPLGVQDVIFEMRPALTGEFQIILTEPPPITVSPRIRVEYAEGISAAQLSSVRERLARRLRDLLVFTPDVELLAPGTLPRTERKAKRLYRQYRGEVP
jgi:phenylacetate-CoA ligase